MHFFFRLAYIRQKVHLLEQKFAFNNANYFLVIKKFNGEMLFKLADIIFQLQNIHQRFFWYSKNSIQTILQFFLPYNFFFALNQKNAYEVKKSLLGLRNSDLFLYTKKREDQNMVLISWSNAFWKQPLASHLFFNNQQIQSFFLFYNKFRFFFRTNTNLIKNAQTLAFVYKPVVLFEHLSLAQSLYLVYFFEKKFPNLPLSFLPIEAKILHNHPVLL